MAQLADYTCSLASAYPNVADALANGAVSRAEMCMCFVGNGYENFGNGFSFSGATYSFDMNGNNLGYSANGVFGDFETGTITFR